MMDGTAAASPFCSPVTALDGPDKVTGAARYTFDVTLPGMVHAKVLRSLHRTPALWYGCYRPSFAGVAVDRCGRDQIAGPRHGVV
jgi:hypothetical protein